MALGLVESVISLGGDHPTRYFTIVLAVAYFGYVLLLRLVAYISLSRSYKINGCERPPRYPIYDPIFGIDFTMGNIRAFRESRFLERQMVRYSETGTTHYAFLNCRQFIYTIDPENIKAILATNFKDYEIANRKTIMGPLLGRGIFVSDGEDWMHSRSLLRPNFVKDQLADLDMLERHMQELIHVLPKHPSEVVDLQEYFLSFTMDSATEFLFGQSTNTLIKSTARDQEFGEAFKLSLKNMSLQMRRGPLNRYYRKDPEVARAYKTCRDYVATYVDSAIAMREDTKAESFGDDGSEGRTERYYFLKELAQVLDDKERIRDELLNILVAGRDTTASLLASAFHVLSRRPDLWRKLRNEVSDLDGLPPSYEQLRNLKFSKYMLNETLRLYPPVALNGRSAKRDTILPTGGGAEGTSPIFVPKGQPVVYSPYVMHRRKDFYGEDALEFRPERWETQRHGWEYLPFNGGPRICLGQQYALTEATYVMVRLAQEYSSIVTADGTPWTEDLALTIAVKGGVNCRLTAA